MIAFFMRLNQSQNQQIIVRHVMIENKKNPEYYMNVAIRFVGLAYHFFCNNKRIMH